MNADMLAEYKADDYKSLMYRKLNVSIENLKDTGCGVQVEPPAVVSLAHSGLVSPQELRGAVEDIRGRWGGTSYRSYVSSSVALRAPCAYRSAQLGHS